MKAESETGHTDPKMEPVTKCGSFENNQLNADADLTISPAQARRLLLKTDLVIMPLIILSMTLAFLDKVNDPPPGRTSPDPPN